MPRAIVALSVRWDSFAARARSFVLRAFAVGWTAPLPLLSLVASVNDYTHHRLRTNEGDVRQFRDDGDKRVSERQPDTAVPRHSQKSPAAECS